jgi:hypothetical protein
MRHDLRRKEGGLLACPDDYPGREAAELSRLNAESAAAANSRPEPRYSGGSADTRTLPVIQRTTAADITRYDE